MHISDSLQNLSEDCPAEVRLEPFHIQNKVEQLAVLTQLRHQVNLFSLGFSILEQHSFATGNSVQNVLVFQVKRLLDLNVLFTYLLFSLRLLLLKQFDAHFFIVGDIFCKETLAKFSLSERLNEHIVIDAL